MSLLSLDNARLAEELNVEHEQLLTDLRHFRYPGFCLLITGVLLALLICLAVLCGFLIKLLYL
jgi:hypothetical protein